VSKFFDSSVLVPVFYADHEHHEASTSVYLTANKDDFCARRSLGEVYATLTGLPVRPRITGPEAVSLVGQIRERLTLVSLSDAEYLSALESASPAIIGGAFYDWLIATCAIKAGATTLITWNVKHFSRFGPEVAELVRTPLEVIGR
jgi:predicted nucleic acid-binding protein